MTEITSNNKYEIFIKKTFWLKNIIILHIIPKTKGKINSKRITFIHG